MTTYIMMLGINFCKKAFLTKMSVTGVLQAADDMLLWYIAMCVNHIRYALAMDFRMLG